MPGSDGKFDVNPTTGQLIVNGSLDFETKSSYTFMVSDILIDPVSLQDET